jgi:nicotinamidase-related amidase
MARVWDKFLSASDREHVASRSSSRIGFGEKPALLLIDLYRAVFGDKPEPLMQAVKTWPSSCGMAGWDALPHIQRLLQGAREAKVPVLHVTMLTGAGMPGWSEAARRDTARPAQDLDVAALDRKRRGADIIDEVAPIAGETVLRKAAPSAFWGTPLAGQLTYLGVDTLIVAGESTSGCVRASVVDAVSHRYRVQVVEECVFDRHEAPHAINLFDLDQKYADVIQLEEALAWLGRHAAAHARQREFVPA